MPNIDDMFQSKYVSYRDLEINKSYWGTIHSVQIEAARSGVGGNPGFRGQPGQAVEAEWIMWFAEYQKPFKLKSTKARVLAAIFNEKNTDLWSGRKVCFYRGTTTIGQEVKESINLDEPTTRREAMKPVPKQPAQLLDMGKVRTNIPRVAVDRFIGQLKEQSKRWADFLTWLKTACPDGHGMAMGADLDTISGALLPAMGEYIKQIKPQTAIEPAANDAGDARARAEETRDTYEPIQEEDIPF